MRRFTLADDAAKRRSWMISSQRRCRHSRLPDVPSASRARRRGLRGAPIPKDIDGTDALRSYACSRAAGKAAPARRRHGDADAYGIEAAGKRTSWPKPATGRPVAMMLERNATVTVCHSRTRNLEQAIREPTSWCLPRAVRSTAHRAFARANRLDVGINGCRRHLCGDADCRCGGCRGEAGATRPPRGIGVTTSVP
ncbi:MAG: hypothetical protein ACLT98_09130 [Eggerthellaceae bacterium]